MLKRTPLWPRHQQLGARLVEFGGWDMPVQYTRIVEEHLAVRSAAGLFDISHMGEFLVSGEGALEFLNGELTNDLRKCQAGQGQYTLLCRETGGVIDDLYAYCLGAQSYLLIVNASRIDADYHWLRQRLDASPVRSAVELVNASDAHGAVALQGPRAVEFVDQCLAGPASQAREARLPSSLKKNEIARFDFEGAAVWLGRTGYTGEDGFEVVAPASAIVGVWDRMLQAGQPFGLKPCGLGARDTLRTEMGYPLYGHELDLETTPIEAGLSRFVSFDKGDFVGRAALVAQKSLGIKKKCVAFKLRPQSAPPRPQYPILNGEGRAIGRVVSGTQSPSLGLGIGMGYVEPDFAASGTAIQVEIRGKLSPGEVVSKPIYRKSV